MTRKQTTADKAGEPIGDTEQMCRDYLELNERIKQLEKRKKKMRDQFERNFKVGKHPVGDFRVLVYESQRTTMDKDKLKVLLGPKFDLYTKVSKTTGVRIELLHAPPGEDDEEADEE